MKLLISFLLIFVAHGQIIVPAAAQTKVDWITQVKNKPALDVREYAFVRSPGGSVSAGSRTITLSPFPVGLAVDNYLYISGGTGTAEAVPITAVGATTVTVTCANSHSGAWTIGSASGGLQESIAATAGLGAVNVLSVVDVHAPISAPSVSGGLLIIEGKGISSYTVRRASDYTAGNLFQLTDKLTAVIFRDLGIDNNPPGTSMTGAAIYVENTQNSVTANGTVYLDGVQINGGQYGFRSVGAGVEIRNTVVFSYDTSYKPAAAISLEGPYVGGSRLPISNIVFQNVKVFAPSSANSVSAGLKINGVDGGTFTDVLAQGDVPLLIQATNGNYNTLIHFDQLFIDQARSAGVRFTSDGTGSIAKVRISNSHVGGATAGPGIDMGCSAATNISLVQILNSDIEINATQGICAAVNNNVIIAGNHIYDNNTSNAGFVAGVHFVSATGPGHLIQNNIIGDLPGSVTGHTVYGIKLDGAFTGDISNNDVSQVASNPILLAAAITGTFGPNTGIDELVPNVNSAATLSLPMQKHWKLIGTTGVTAVTAVLPAGSTGTFVGGGGTFTAGASIGNSGTAAAGALYTWMWDGTVFYIAGPGF